MTKIWREYETRYPSVRHRKVEKAIIFSLQRSKYFLGAKINKDLEETTSELTNGLLKIYSERNHKIYLELFELDALIRSTDDLIDEDILTRKHYSLEEVRQTINRFSKLLPAAKQVTQLFRV